MVVKLNAPRTPATAGPIDLLLECHGRIRTFSGMALKMLEPGLDEELIADGARRVHRYFSVALPLHVTDEDVSFRSRLESSRELLPVLDRLMKEHADIDGSLEELLPIWEMLGSEPRRLDEHRASLQARTKAITDLLEAHLRLEETELFPAARRILRPEQLSEIAQEMRARRA